MIEFFIIFTLQQWHICLLVLFFYSGWISTTFRFWMQIRTCYTFVLHWYSLTFADWLLAFFPSIFLRGYKNILEITRWFWCRSSSEKSEVCLMVSLAKEASLCQTMGNLVKRGEKRRSHSFLWWCLRHLCIE